MQPWQERVISEKTELDEKHTKLLAFLETEEFSKLDADEQDRLRRQSAAMTEYSVVLGERISAFGPGRQVPLPNDA